MHSTVHRSGVINTVSMGQALGQITKYGYMCAWRCLSDLAEDVPDLIHHQLQVSGPTGMFRPHSASTSDHAALSHYTAPPLVVHQYVNRTILTGWVLGSPCSPSTLTDLLMLMQCVPIQRYLTPGTPCGTVTGRSSGSCPWAISPSADMYSH